MRACLLLLFPAVALAEPVTPVVTKAFMRQIAAGTVKPADLVDPEAGVLFVVYTSTEADPPVVKRARRRCGADAERAIARIVRDELGPAVAANEVFSCRNRPRPACVAGIAGEFQSKNEYVFRPDPDGKLVLDTIITTNVVYSPPDEARVIARLRARHVLGRCP